MKKILSAVICCLMLLGLVSNVVCADESYVAETSDGIKYTTIAEAIEKAKDGDTITILKAGSYTAYKGVGAGNLVSTKSLTFVGTGTDTIWYIGAAVPRDGYVGEYDGDYSFDGSKNITLKNMTVKVSDGSKPYLGYIRVENFTCEDCTIYGQITYGGRETATYKNCTFNAPGSDYSIWSIDGHEITFDGCTFNGAGKIINAYKHYFAEEEERLITINYKDCKVVSTKANKSVINIKDTDGTNTDTDFVVNFSGTNTVEGLESNKFTCSVLFQVASEKATDPYHATVYIDGTKVWENSAMVDHNIDCENDKYTDGYKYDDFTYVYGEWEKQQDDDGLIRTVERTCNICGYNETYTEIMKSATPSEPTVPSTGDTTNLAMLALTMLASGTAAMGLVIKKKKD